MTRYCYRCRRETEHEDAGHVARRHMRHARCTRCGWVRYVKREDQ